VFREKRREDAIRDEDLAVVRWTWQDLDEFTGVAASLPLTHTVRCSRAWSTMCASTTRYA
jgi:hypothetical protein